MPEPPVPEPEPVHRRRARPAAGEPEPEPAAPRPSPAPVPTARPSSTRRARPGTRRARRSGPASTSSSTGERDLETGEHDAPATGEDDLDDRRARPGTGEHDLETGEHELEMPSGTRRVSVLDKPPVQPPPRKPKKRKPLQRERQPGGPGEGRRRHSWLVRIASLVALALAAGVIWFLIEAVPAVRRLAPRPGDGDDPAALDLEPDRRPAGARRRDLLELLLRRAGHARRRAQRHALRRLPPPARG